MILDSLNKFNNYLSLNKNFHLVTKFLSQNSTDELETGRYELQDGNYAMVNTYNTRHLEECFIECHRKYIDIQIIISGKEKVGICSIDECIENEYNPEKDFSVLKGNTDFITLKEGFFAIFFPQDGHMPGICIADNIKTVKKIVFKIVV